MSYKETIPQLKQTYFEDFTFHKTSDIHELIDSLADDPMEHYMTQLIPIQMNIEVLQVLNLHLHSLENPNLHSEHFFWQMKERHVA